MRTIILLGALCATQAALAAPKIESISVKPSAAEVSVSVSVARSRFDSGGCDARVDFGDGQGRNLDFGMAGTRSVHYAYKKNGSYKVTVKGTGATPCEGSREAPVVISGVPEPKKPEAKKAEPSKTQPPKKTDAKKAPAKKPAPKKPAPKKPDPKKDEAAK